MALFDQTAFQRDLLFVIASLDQPSGQTIKQQFETETDLTVNRGRIYPNLGVLVEEGLIEKGALDRRTNCYTLTRKGLNQVQQRQEWEREHLSSLPRNESTTLRNDEDAASVCPSDLRSTN